MKNYSALANKEKINNPLFWISICSQIVVFLTFFLLLSKIYGYIFLLWIARQIIFSDIFYQKYFMVYQENSYCRR